MLGMDLFFKSAAAGIKIAQQGMDNMFKMMDLFMGLSYQTKKPAKKEGPIMKKTTDTPEPPSVVTEPKPVSEKSIVVPKVNTEQPLKNMSPSAPVSTQKTTLNKRETKKEKKPVSPQNQLPSKKKLSTATDEVQAFMARQKQGASIEDIMKSTGYSKKKVQDILYKLKKRGVLKVEKGAYFSV
jgi:hypothetical protein